ncbi:uncharacterized protein K444DRAFT_608261 [Hyaloscypha bicolor E]|uniref:Uncharacterized protein n=1 Tax=Hyaloscypha bicolor E TaxID=1095630 RepID=A0A2J6TRU5_9HELO|nr:uncharacterized protein K444DRAFT_608261 [Hyaloscypha bicolor E]PMD65688.1 hypothetical protein K444DRAFT_608261 [Hyaloscypha bicolor E]
MIILAFAATFVAAGCPGGDGKSCCPDGQFSCSDGIGACECVPCGQECAVNCC